MIPSSKVTVGHYLRSYPTLTETFILPLLVETSRIRPMVFARALGREAGSTLTAISTAEPPDAGRLRRRIEARLRGFELREELALWEALRAQPSLDVIHAHFGPQGYAAARAAKRLDLPLVCSFYGFDLKLGRDPAWRRRYQRLWDSAAAFVVEGPYMGETLIGLGAPRSKVMVQPLPIGVESIPFSPRSVSEPLRLLQVARMVEKKGIDLTIRAVAALHREGISVELTLIGDGPERASLDRLASDLGIAEAVHFLGPRSHAESLDALAQAHLLVQPSRTAHDGDTEGGAPYTLLEAQATGVLVVASRHADIPNVVAPEALFAFDENDVEGLVEALHRARACSAEWEARGQAGREHVARANDIANVIPRMEDLYQRLASTRAPARRPPRYRQ